MTRSSRRHAVAGFLALAIGFAPSPAVPTGGAAPAQPTIGARVKAVLTVDGLRFKDANGNGQLEPYEDWRLEAEARAADLVGRMTLDEKAGAMLIDSLSPGFGGEAPKAAEDYVNVQKMTRFVLRSVVTASPVRASGPALFGQPVTPEQAASFTNRIQEMAEATRLGIPALFKSNARNHYERDARFAINTEAGSFSQWPKEAGLAATRDLALVADFARTMGQEWRAIGLRGMYGYMADLATEPRWYRVHETFSEDADLTAEIIETLVLNLQGGPVSPATAVALTVKHFPGGGPQQLGLDPHFTFGKNQVYPAGRFDSHLKPFRAAIDAGVSSVMPYYGVPIDLTYGGVAYQPTGMAFSKQIVGGLLRETLGFRGYVNSDTGIIDDRAWGLEGRSVPERVAAAIDSGTDVLSGFHEKQTITDLVTSGLLSQARVDEAVTRLLVVQLRLGLFEDPYVDAGQANAIVGRADFRARALDAQRKSIVLLQNRGAGESRALPLPKPTPARPIRLYTMGLSAAVAGAAEYGYTVVAGDYDAAKGERRPPASGADRALIRIEVTNPRDVTSSYASRDPATGANPAHVNPLTGRPWGAEDATGLDDGLRFGGSFPWEAGQISFSAMARSRSWRISPPLADIRAVMAEVGADKTVLAIYFRQPYVLDEASGLREAGAILAGFGVGDAALMDVASGRARPQGKLPFALARTLEAVSANAPDAPGYPAADTLFPFGFGLGY